MYLEEITGQTLHCPQLRLTSGTISAAAAAIANDIRGSLPSSSIRSGPKEVAVHMTIAISPNIAWPHQQIPGRQTEATRVCRGRPQAWGMCVDALSCYLHVGDVTEPLQRVRDRSQSE